MSPKILLVEDEPSVRKLCAELLAGAGYDPISAVDGADGLRIYRERHAEISLIVTDVVMPKMGGLEMAANVLKMRSDASIVLMSGYGLPDKLPPQIRAVISKPFGPKQLIEVVRNCLAVAA